MAVHTYRAAGVDIASAEATLARLKPLIRSTHGDGVLPDLGQFAGLFRLPKDLREPVLVSSTDGVGTKLKLAQLVDEHVAIGIDVVAMNTNDVLVYGATPLFFLDYVAMGKLEPRRYRELLQGIVDGCKQSGCALLGGETAEMPGVYEPDEYDVAGFCVGVVERQKIVDGRAIQAGDIVIGLASSGVHANGFSLIRKVFSTSELTRLKRELLVPTRIYVKPVLAVLERVRLTGIVHITGGGLARRLPSLGAKRPALAIAWRPDAWPVPPIFRRIQEAGRIAEREMYATFNMGLGMAVTCRPRDAASVMRIVTRTGISAWSIGTVRRRSS